MISLPEKEALRDKEVSESRSSGKALGGKSDSELEPRSSSDRGESDLPKQMAEPTRVGRNIPVEDTMQKRTEEDRRGDGGGVREGGIEVSVKKGERGPRVS